MHIVLRDRSLKYPRAIRREKQQFVLDWLLEFRFSSLALLARRLDLRNHPPYTFFRSLLDNGLVQRFTHVQANQEKYYMLTRLGAALLHEAGRDIAHACTSPSRLTHYAPLLHDLAVQRLVLNRLSGYRIVIWDRHITLPPPYDRPGRADAQQQTLLDCVRI